MLTIGKQYEVSQEGQEVIFTEITPTPPTPPTPPTTGGNYWVNVKDNGIANLIGDGTTDDSAGLVAILAGVVEGVTLFFPQGTYVINGVFVENKVNFLSSGATILVTGNDVGIRFRNQTQGAFVEGFIFEGSGKASNKALNIGLSFYQSKNWRLFNCVFKDFSGRGLELASTYSGAGVANTSGGVVSGCVFTENNVGLFANTRGEYLLVSSSCFDNNSIAVKDAAGNNNFTGLNINYNSVGVSVENAVNEGHGIIANCNINHNSTAIKVVDIGLGHNIINNNIYANAVSFALIRSVGLKFQGNTIAAGDIDIEDSKIVFQNNIVDSSAIPTVNLTGVNSIVQSGNFDFNNSVFSL